MIKAVLFDLDNTLYDTKTQAYHARVSAVKAMVSEGLKLSVDEAVERLLSLVKEHGSNYDNHFDRLLEKTNQADSPRIIAAGVAAYHDTKRAYLVPYPQTIPTLLSLRQMDIKLAVVSNGKPVKQWEKLIRLGLQHFFHTVIIKEKDGKPNPEPIIEALENLDVEKEDAIMVGDKLEFDIQAAVNAGVKNAHFIIHPESFLDESGVQPDFLISSLDEVLKIIAE